MLRAHHHAGRVLWCVPRFTSSPNPPTQFMTLVGFRVFILLLSALLSNSCSNPIPLCSSDREVCALGFGLVWEKPNKAKKWSGKDRNRSRNGLEGNWSEACALGSGDVFAAYWSRKSSSKAQNGPQKHQT